MQRTGTGELHHHHHPGDEDGCLDITARPYLGHEGWRTPTIEEDSDLPPVHSQLIREYSQYDPVTTTHHRETMARTATGRGDNDNDDDDDRETEVQCDDDGGDDEAEKPKNLSWKQRMQHVTWAWFTLTMATGGIANVLHDGKVSTFVVFVFFLTTF